VISCGIFSCFYFFSPQRARRNTKEVGKKSVGTGVPCRWRPGRACSKRTDVSVLHDRACPTVLQTADFLRSFYYPAAGAARLLFAGSQRERRMWVGGMGAGSLPSPAAVFCWPEYRKTAITVFRFPRAFAYSVVKERPGPRARGTSLGYLSYQLTVISYQLWNFPFLDGESAGTPQWGWRGWSGESPVTCCGVLMNNHPGRLRGHPSFRIRRGAYL
jgi:hypothetical protein